MATAIRVENYGEVFTRRWVVDAILDLVGYSADSDLAAGTVVEPSCGTGAFLGPVVERLLASAQRTGVAYEKLGSCIQAFDLQQSHVDDARALAAEALRLDGCEFALADRLAEQWVQCADYLLDDTSLSADWVVGNPPYIRIEDLNPEIAAEYRSRWSTMNGRADIYVPFFERSLLALRPGGRLGFICADRWFRNSYGAALRRLVSDGFAVQHIWTMHDVDAFASEVSAYPAITVLAATPQGEVTVLDTDATFGPGFAPAAAKWALGTETTSTSTGFRGHRLPQWFSGDGFWPTGTPARLSLIEHLTDRFPSLEDKTTGTKVGIGIATGADQAYILKDPEVVEAERALPLVVGSDLNSGTFVWGNHYLANVWESDGRLVDLAEYPRLESQLIGYAEGLKGRHTAKKNLANWHRTIDKVNHALLDRPLLMMRDLGATANPVLVPAGYYPHHNVYWVSSDVWDLEVLGGLMLSRVAQAFIEAYCVRMRGGTLRFQAQYLRQIRVPDPSSLAPGVEAELRQAFRDRDADLATTASCTAFGINPTEYELDG